MRSTLVGMILLAACGGTRYRTELVGQGTGTVGARDPASSVAVEVTAAPGGTGVQLPQGNYELAMRFDVPRAQLVDWRITCPGVDLDGQVGETLERYRARRSAELTRERDEQRARTTTAASIVIGAVAKADVDVQISGGAPVLPAPDDIGRGTLVASARVITAGDGVCALAVTADDAHDVRAAFTITRIRDLAAEDRMRMIATREVAVKTRGALTAQLVTAGADPAAHHARRAAAHARASARAQAELDARLAHDTQLRARADIRARLEAAALYARQEYLAFLAGKCSADPHRRDRVAAEERRRREARLVAYADLAQRRDQLALTARTDLRAQLLRWGAKARPPMPAPKPEAPGAAPFAGAEWTAGYWSWESGDWSWQDGGWRDPDLFESSGDSGYVGVSVGAGGASPSPGTRDHRRSRVRDHRDLEDPPSWQPTSRDSGAKVRDHRESENARSVWTPSSRENVVRDHRKDDDKKDDDKPRVRDHR